MTKINEKLIQETIQQLASIGFTQLESEIYLFLLSNGANTGYSIAKGIGKAVANVYKAAESLANKGGVEHAMGDSKLFIAISWKTLLKQQQKNFSSNIANLTHSFNHLPEYKSDEHVYQLNQVDQVIEQTIRIIDESCHILLAEIEPDAMQHFSTALTNAAQRGVDVRIKVYQPTELKGVKVTCRKHGEQVYGKTADVGFTLCADGEELIIALLNEKASGVIQAFRSKSALMNMSIYCGLLYELVLTELKMVIPSGDINRAQEILKETEYLNPFSQENSVFDAYIRRYEV